jgi:hypothetical protein
MQRVSWRLDVTQGYATEFAKAFQDSPDCERDSNAKTAARMERTLDLRAQPTSSGTSERKRTRSGIHSHLSPDLDNVADHPLARRLDDSGMIVPAGNQRIVLRYNFKK